MCLASLLFMSGVVFLPSSYTNARRLTPRGEAETCCCWALQDKIDVNGEDAHPLYKFLRAAQPVSQPSSKGSGMNPFGEPGAIEWNCTSLDKSLLHGLIILPESDPFCPGFKMSNLVFRKLSEGEELFVIRLFQS